MTKSHRTIGVVQTSLTTKDKEIVITRADIAIPANPIRCNVLRPALSTRKSWRQNKKILIYNPINIKHVL